MKKSNKLSLFYVIVSFVLFVTLLGGGVYGVYISVGLNFVRSNVSNVTNGIASNVASNMSYGSGFATGNNSMFGVIALSVALLVLAVFDLVSMIKQIVFFKQFKVIKNSTIEQVIEKKVKTKKSVLVFAFIIDTLSFVVALVGLFLNARSFSGIGSVWVLYLIDGAVCLFSIISVVLLIAKYNKAKKSHREQLEKNKDDKVKLKNDNVLQFNFADNVDKLEYCLLKLKHLKTSKIISLEEYSKLRSEILGNNESKMIDFEKEKQSQI